MPSVTEKSLPRADFPEQVGVSSKAVAELIADMQENNIEAHSIMILRHGKVAFETWRDPYAPDVPHTMYSVSKSFSSIATGFAIDEGLYSLDSKVIDFFPEFRPKKADPWLEEMTVFHLLTMTAGKDVSLLENKAKSPDWVRSFFHAAWAFEPGKGWKYISENCYMLCAILHRVTGQSVREFLAPRLFKPLGIREKPFWETDSRGVEAGGWGLFITTEELAKTIQCMSDGGKFNGKQVIPEFWATEAGKYQADNSSNSDHDVDCQCGYGFNFWRCAPPNTYRADGMFSQFGIVFGDHDANFIITCSEVFEKKTREAIWRHFPGGFIEPSNEPVDCGLPMEFEPLPVLPARPHSALESKLKDKRISLRYRPILNAVGFPVSVLSTAVVYMSADRAGNINDIRFSFSGDECRFSWSEGAARNTVVCGMDGKYRLSPMRLGGIDFTAVSSACWEDSKTLSIWIRPRESICERRLVFRFDGDHVSMSPSSCPDLREIASSIAAGTGSFIPNKLLAELSGDVLMRIYPVLEPKHNGRLERK